MEWDQEIKDSVVANAMDLCTNIDQFRQIVIMTITNEGMFSVVQNRKHNASGLELIGALHVLVRDETRVFDGTFKESNRPMGDAEKS